MTKRWSQFSVSIAGLLFASTAPAAVSIVSDNRISGFRQTPSGLQESNSIINFEVDSSTGDSITAGSVTTPGNVDYALTSTGATSASRSFYPANGAAMSAAFADGTYKYDVTTTLGGTVHFEDAFDSALRPDVVPMITNLSSLSAMDATQAITIQTSLFADEGYQRTGYLLINDGSGHVVFDDSGADIFSGTIILPANTLMNGTAYFFQLDWGNYTGRKSNGTVLFDNYRLNTSGSFLVGAPSAPVPEPQSWMAMILGFAMIGETLRRHRAGASGSARPSRLAF